VAKPGLEGVFADWKEREALAEAMIPLIGGLYRRNVVIYIHGVPFIQPICHRPDEGSSFRSPVGDERDVRV
jgi:hypothetical protein